MFPVSFLTGQAIPGKTTACKKSLVIDIEGITPVVGAAAAALPTCFAFRD